MLASSVALGIAMALPAAALADFSFTSNVTDAAFSDQSRAEFSFGVSGPAEVTLRTWSYAGGTNAAGEEIPSGGFDPVVSVFGSDGALIAYNDDGSGVVDPDTGLSYDSLQTLYLEGGNYAAVLSEYANFSNGTIDDFQGNSSTAIADGYRTAFWALDILNVDSAAFLRIVNSNNEPAPPTQEQINAALQDISVNGNTSSTAAVISKACPQAEIGSRFREDCTPIVLGALAPADSELNNQASAALLGVTAEQASVPLSSSRASISSQLQNLSTRLSALRAGAAGINLAGFAFNLDEQIAPGMPVAAGSFPAGTGGAAGADSPPILDNERLGVFVNGIVNNINKDATGNEDGFDASGWAVTGGIDYRFRDNLVAGIAVGYYTSSTDIDNNGGNLDTDGYSFSLYGTYYQGERFYVDGMLTYGNNDYDQRRNIRYQVGAVGVSQSAKASYGGEQWSAAVAAGYNLSAGPWTYGPVVNLGYVSASVDSYRERMSDPNANGGGWAANLGNMDQESLTSSLGADVSRALSTPWGVVLPQVHLGWVHEFRDDAISVNGMFVEDPTNGIFSITGDKPDSDYFNARLGVSAQLPGGTTAFLYYNKVFGYRDLDVDTFGAGVRLVF